jgi:hypothetical protein
MSTNRYTLLGAFILASVLLLLSFKYVQRFYYHKDNIYTKFIVSEEKKASLPVRTLLDGIKANQKHIIRHSFYKKEEYFDFLNSL